MRSVDSSFASAARILLLLCTLAVIFSTSFAQRHPQRQKGPHECNAVYTKHHDGKSTYGLDDGGCWMCSQNPRAKEEDKIPLTDDHLVQHCKLMCEADKQCVTFTVSRPANLPAQEYYYGQGVKANCCLERRSYPPELFVDANLLSDPNGKKNNCQMDSACWTRYEKQFETRGGRKFPVNRPCGSGDASSKPHVGGSDLCSPVWPAVAPYTDDELKKKADFISQGCPYNDTKLERMLEGSYGQCREEVRDEVFAESTAVSIIVHPRGVYTHVSLDDWGALKAFG